MSDDDLIRRGDALAEIRRIFGGLPNWVADAIAALPAVTVGAAALLKDVPRHSLDFCDRMEIDKDGVWMHEDHVLAALEPLAAPDPALRPTMTDMMVDPDMLDAFMEANPLPPDPAPAKQVTVSEAEAIREAALHVENAKRLRRYDWQEWTAQDVEDAEGIICAFLALIQNEKETNQ